MNSSARLPHSEDDDAGFFDALYAGEHRVLYAYLLGAVGSADAAADLLQETFLRVWRHLDDARQVPSDRTRYWLLAIARNLVLDHRRRQTVRGRQEEASGDLADSRSASDPVQSLIARETARTIDAAIAELPDTLRVPLTLHLLGDMTSAEIGRCLQRPSGTIRYQIACARRRIAERMLQWDEIDEGRRAEER